MNFVYVTTNLINGKQYVGSHDGSEKDEYLGSGKVFLKALKKYGKQNFSRKILEYCDPFYNVILEEKYIEKLNTLKPNGYNISPTGGHARGKLSKETIEKIRQSNLGKKRSIETKQKLSKSLSGRKLSEQTKEKMSNFQKGRIKSEEERKNISESKKGQKNPIYGKNPWNKGKTGFKHSEKTKQKMRESHKRNYN